MVCPGCLPMALQTYWRLCQDSFLSAWGETLNTMIESYVPPGYAAQFIPIRQVIFSFPWPLLLCYANKYACAVGPNLNKNLTVILLDTARMGHLGLITAKGLFPHPLIFTAYQCSQAQLSSSLQNAFVIFIISWKKTRQSPFKRGQEEGFSIVEETGEKMRRGITIVG